MKIYTNDPDTPTTSYYTHAMQHHVLKAVIKEEVSV